MVNTDSGKVVRRFTQGSRSDVRVEAAGSDSVVFRDAYTGIDINYYGRDRLLEYDFIVKPAGDPDVIRVRIPNADAVSIDEMGALQIIQGHTAFTMRKPFAYQVATDGTVEEVKVSYRVVKDGGVAFDLASYDRERVLVIDPIVQFGTYLGGAAFDQIWDVATDDEGFIYVVGETDSANLDENIDAFLAKFTPDGSELMYISYLAGSGDEGALAIELDSLGRPVVTGFTSSTDLPLVNAFQSTHGGSMDAFVARFSTDGDLDFCSYLGGALDDEALDIAVDGSGQLFVCGQTLSTDFPAAEAGEHQGFEDGFLVKIDAEAPSILATVLIGGSDDDSSEGLAIVEDGVVVVGGLSRSSDLPVVAALQEQNAGGWDAFVFRWDSGNDQLTHGTYLGGSALDRISRLSVQPGSDSVVATGQTFSGDFPTLAPIQSSKVGGADAFLIRLDPSSLALQSSTFLGGSGDDAAWDIGCDANGIVVIAGSTASDDFPSVMAEPRSIAGDEDAFMIRVASNLNGLDFAASLGGEGVENVFGIAVEPGGSIALGGFTDSESGIATEGADASQNAGIVDGFVIKYLADQVLGISTSSDGIKVTWPQVFPSYQLQRRSNFESDSGMWNDVEAMDTELGAEFILDNTGDPQGFFRLRPLE